MRRINNGRCIDPTAVIGAPMRMLQGCVQSTAGLDRVEVVLPKVVYIGPYASIGLGVCLGEKVIVDSFCSIEPRAIIGARTLVIYRTTIGSDSVVGEDCVIGGFVGESSIVGNGCRVMGDLIHSHRDTSMSWDHHDTPELAPVLDDNVFVGVNSLVIGGIRLGSRSYVCAGSTLTRDLPPFHIAFGKNSIVHYTEWRGPLKDSPHFYEEG